MTGDASTDPVRDAPPWRDVDLPGIGLIEVRDSGPATEAHDQPAILLLHGWTASADLNWCRTYGPLTSWFGGRTRLVAWDHRGHGARGLRTGTTTELDDLADDAAAIARALGIEQAVAVGYSMGGAVAQALWRRHNDLVVGLVLGATAARFAVDDRQRRNFDMIGRGVGPSRLLEAMGCGRPAWRYARWLGDRRAPGSASTGDTAFDEWAWRETRAGVLSQVLAAGRDLGRFDSTGWLDGVDVPHAVLVCEKDETVPTVRQRELVAALPYPTIHEIAADHAACVTRPELFIPALTKALESVLPSQLHKTR